MTIAAPFAHLGGMLATDLVQVADLAADPSVLDRGWWAVVGTFEGKLTGYRFDRVVAADLPPPTGSWPDPAPEGWATSLNRDEYLAGVRRIGCRRATRRRGGACCTWAGAGSSARHRNCSCPGTATGSPRPRSRAQPGRQSRSRTRTFPRTS